MLLELKSLKLSINTLWVVVTFITTLFITIIVSIINIKENPSLMLRPKVFKKGGKIFLEKINFIWRHLKFKYKSTIRNMFKYKGRFFMTVISVLGSTALIFCGFGLYQCLVGMKNDSLENLDSLVDSIIPVSIAIITCALFLCILVIFNLTNISIEERKREIATLKVLGYMEFEANLFIYREIFFLSLIGIILGLPTGYYFLGFIFDYLEFGKLEYIKITVWIYTVLVSFVAIIITDVILNRKVNNITMHSCLKSFE